MKKLLSMILVVVMMFALGMTASATNGENKGSITITNATVDATYTVYRIFDAKIKTTAGGGVTYTIKRDSQFFSILFGADGTASNTFFNYNSTTGEVKKNEGVNDTELTNYLSNLVRSGTYTPATESIKAVVDSNTGKSAQVVFSDIPYGYYVINTDKGSVVTIDSNTPDVSVIDKNQAPGREFDKQILIKEENNTEIYGESNSVNVGDRVKYKVSFNATNYDGKERIDYYSLHDQKGDGIWVEFNSFKVWVGNTELKKGYYLCYGDDTLNTGEWGYLGDWTGVTKSPSNADWYLIHLGYDEFRISIPWLTNHTLKETNRDEHGKVTSHSFEFPDNAESKFASPSTVTITYTATVEPTAQNGVESDGNLYNKAHATWTTESGGGSSTKEDKVTTKVYGIAIEKKDSADGKHLAGAQFRIYSTENHDNPVYVIPTDIQGVYIVDSLGKYAVGVTGANMFVAREKYAAFLTGYLGTKTQDNLLVTPVNGRIIVLGLEEGTYYVEEVMAPDGYNAMHGFKEIKAGENIVPVTIFASGADQESAATELRTVADLKETDGIHKEKIYNLTSVDVENSTGLELPSTGGTGRTIIFTTGTILAMVFAVLLITHKKMSVYTD